jgi:hypothetical protein
VLLGLMGPDLNCLALKSWWRVAPAYSDGYAVTKAVELPRRDDMGVPKADRPSLSAIFCRGTRWY